MSVPPKKVRCVCSHEFQDKQYGKGVRLANPLAKPAKSAGPQEYRCTVCSKIHG